MNMAGKISGYLDFGWGFGFIASVGDLELWVCLRVLRGKDGVACREIFAIQRRRDVKSTLGDG